MNMTTKMDDVCSGYFLPILGQFLMDREPSPLYKIRTYPTNLLQVESLAIGLVKEG